VRTAFFVAVYIGLGFFLAYELGRNDQARALKGCEIVASQAVRDVTEAEGKASACESIFTNLGSLEEGVEP